MHPTLERINERVENYRQRRSNAQTTLGELRYPQQDYDEMIEYYERNIAPIIGKIGEMGLDLESFWVSFDRKFPAI